MRIHDFSGSKIMVELVCPAYIAKRYPPTIDCGVKKPPGAEVDQHGVEKSSIVQYWPITVSYLRVYLHLACALFQDIIRGICVSRDKTIITFYANYFSI